MKEIITHSSLLVNEHVFVAAWRQSCPQGPGLIFSSYSSLCLNFPLCLFLQSNKTPQPSSPQCAARHLDLNSDSLLSRSELDTAIGTLNFLSRSVLKVIGSTDIIMSKCDYDSDGFIDMEPGGDMEKSKETCLKQCFKRKAFKGAFFPECDTETI